MRYLKYGLAALLLIGLLVISVRALLRPVPPQAPAEETHISMSAYVLDHLPSRYQLDQPLSKTETQRLEAEFRFLHCLAATYRKLTPQPQEIIRGLEGEAWYLVERLSADAEQFERWHQQAIAHAQQSVEPGFAIKGCWAVAEQIH